MSREKRFATPSRLAGLRLGWRLARRTTLRGLGRSTLIVTLIAIPLAGTTAVLTVFQSTVPTTEQRIATSLGTTEAIIWALTPPGSGLSQEPLEPFATSHGDVPPEARVLEISEVVPAGTKVLTLELSEAQAKTAHGQVGVQVLRGPSWDPAFEGMHELEEGRSPRIANEVAVTRSVLERLDVSLGDELSILWPAPATLTVVGIMDDHTQPDRNLSLFVLTNSTVPRNNVNAPHQKRYFLPELALDWAEVQNLNEQGYIALSRSVMLDPPEHAPRFFQETAVDSILISVSIVGTVFAALEVILLAGAAFSVTARQEQRTLALLASVGASPKRIGRLLALRGVILGFLGGVAGMVLGLAIAAGFIAWDSNGSTVQYYGFRLPAVYLALLLAGATLLGWIAALVPGRAVARMDVVGALRGSRRPPEPSKHTPRFGLAFIVIGSLVLAGVAVATPLWIDAHLRGRLEASPHLLGTLLALSGALLLLLGLGLSVSFLLRRLASVFRKAGVSSRLALNDASRNSPRTAPAIAVTLTVTFVASLGMCMLGSMQTSLMSGYLQTAATGTISFPLLQQDVPSDDGGTVEDQRFTDVGAIREILEAHVELNTLSMIWSTERLGADLDKVDPTNGDSATPPQVVAVETPLASLCPRDPRSPEWTPDHETMGTEASAAANTDKRCEGTSHFWFGLGAIQVSDENGLGLILGSTPDQQTLDAFRDGEAIVIDESLLSNGTIAVSWYSPDDVVPPFLIDPAAVPLHSQFLDAHEITLSHQGPFSVVISRATAQKLGLEIFPTVVLVTTNALPSEEQMMALHEAARALPGNFDGQLTPHLERGPTSRIESQGIAMVAIVALSALIALAATAIAVGLARVDSARDLTTLRAVGASPGLQRRLSFAQALIIAGIGTVLGTLLGIAPAAVITQVLELPFSPPWLHLAVLFVGVPLIIATGSALIQRRVRDTSVQL